jgi:hypothetical protein
LISLSPGGERVKPGKQRISKVKYYFISVRGTKFVCQLMLVALLQEGIIFPLPGGERVRVRG